MNKRAIWKGLFVMLIVALWAGCYWHFLRRKPEPERKVSRHTVLRILDNLSKARTSRKQVELASQLRLELYDLNKGSSNGLEISFVWLDKDNNILSGGSLEEQQRITKLMIADFSEGPIFEPVTIPVLSVETIYIFNAPY